MYALTTHSARDQLLRLDLTNSCCETLEPAKSSALQALQSFLYPPMSCRQQVPILSLGAAQAASRFRSRYCLVHPCLIFSFLLSSPPSPFLLSCLSTSYQPPYLSEQHFCLYTGNQFFSHTHWSSEIRCAPESIFRPQENHSIARDENPISNLKTFSHCHLVILRNAISILGNWWSTEASLTTTNCPSTLPNLSATTIFSKGSHCHNEMCLFIHINKGNTHVSNSAQFSLDEWTLLQAKFRKCVQYVSAWIPIFPSSISSVKLGIRIISKSNPWLFWK